MWRLDVDLGDVADLTAEGVLAAHGIDRLDPSRRQWPKTQPIGIAYWRDGARAVLAPSAARDGGRVLAIFRPRTGAPGTDVAEAIAGVTPVRPPRRHRKLPALPQGLRT
jgi:hypothetical protein